MSLTVANPYLHTLDPVHPDSSTPAARPARLDTTTLADIVNGLATAVDLWRPHVFHNPHERARVRLLATPAYEVWLLGWTPGQAVGLHDHGGANAAFFVVDGTLTETVTADPDQRAGGVLLERTIHAGTSGSVEAGHVHDIANRSTSLATSIHVYSKPLRSMGFYDVPEPGVRGYRVRTLWVEEETAVLQDVRVDITLEVSGGRPPIRPNAAALGTVRAWPATPLSSSTPSASWRADPKALLQPLRDDVAVRSG